MIRASPIIPDLKLGLFELIVAFFRCSACDYTIEVEIDRGQITEPTTCDNLECQSKDTMVHVYNRCLYSDKQVCKLQETPGKRFID